MSLLLVSKPPTEARQVEPYFGRCDVDTVRARTIFLHVVRLNGQAEEGALGVRKLNSATPLIQKHQGESPCNLGITSAWMRTSVSSATA